MERLIYIIYRKKTSSELPKYCQFDGIYWTQFFEINEPSINTFIIFYINGIHPLSHFMLNNLLIILFLSASNKCVFQIKLNHIKLLFLFHFNRYVIKLTQTPTNSALELQSHCESSAFCLGTISLFTHANFFFYTKFIMCIKNHFQCTLSDNLRLDNNLNGIKQQRIVLSAIRFWALSKWRVI